MAFSFSMRGIKELNWANRITLLRIGAILPILLFIHFPGRVTCWLAAVLFILAAFSDFLDGYIARREGIVTNFGKFLDPLADQAADLLGAHRDGGARLGSRLDRHRHCYPRTGCDRAAGRGRGQRHDYRGRPLRQAENRASDRGSGASAGALSSVWHAYAAVGNFYSLHCLASHGSVGDKLFLSIFRDWAAEQQAGTAIAE